MMRTTATQTLSRWRCLCYGDILSQTKQTENRHPPPSPPVRQTMNTTLLKMTCLLQRRKSNWKCFRCLSKTICPLLRRKSINWKHLPLTSTPTCPSLRRKKSNWKCHPLTSTTTCTSLQRKKSNWKHHCCWRCLLTRNGQELIRHEEKIKLKTFPLFIEKIEDEVQVVVLCWQPFVGCQKDKHKRLLLCRPEKKTCCWFQKISNWRRQD